MILLTIVLVVFSCIDSATSKSKDYDVCQVLNVPLTAPNDFFYKSADNYPFVGSGLQIYTSAVIPCNGYLYSWRFMPQNEYFAGLHLAVFRQARGFFYVVNETRIEMSLREIRQFPSANVAGLTRDSWMEVIIPEPFQVQQGDYLGVYYDKFVSLRETIAIKTTDDAYNSNFSAPTFVFVDDSTSVQIPSLDPCTRRLLDPKKALITFRQPALTAVIKTTWDPEYQPTFFGDFSMPCFLLVPNAPLPLPSGVDVDNYDNNGKFPPYKGYDFPEAGFLSNFGYPPKGIAKMEKFKIPPLPDFKDYKDFGAESLAPSFSYAPIGVSKKDNDKVPPQLPGSKDYKDFDVESLPPSLAYEYDGELPPPFQGSNDFDFESPSVAHENGGELPPFQGSNDFESLPPGFVQEIEGEFPPQFPGSNDFDFESLPPRIADGNEGELPSEFPGSNDFDFESLPPSILDGNDGELPPFLDYDDSELPPSLVYPETELPPTLDYDGVGSKYSRHFGYNAKAVGNDNAKFVDHESYNTSPTPNYETPYTKLGNEYVKTFYPRPGVTPSPRHTMFKPRIVRARSRAFGVARQSRKRYTPKQKRQVNVRSLFSNWARPFDYHQRRWLK